MSRRIFDNIVEKTKKNVPEHRIWISIIRPSIERSVWSSRAGLCNARTSVRGSKMQQLFLLSRWKVVISWRTGEPFLVSDSWVRLSRSCIENIFQLDYAACESGDSTHGDWHLPHGVLPALRRGLAWYAFEFWFVLSMYSVINKQQWTASIWSVYEHVFDLS